MAQARSGFMMLPTKSHDVLLVLGVRSCWILTQTMAMSPDLTVKHVLAQPEKRSVGILRFSEFFWTVSVVAVALQDRPNGARVLENGQARVPNI